MKHLSFILLFACLTAKAQMPPPVAPVITYLAVTDIDSNGFSSAFSNEISITNGGSYNLNWTPPTNAFSGYVLYWGHKSGVYTMSRAVGTNNNQIWPFPIPPFVWQKTFSYLHSSSPLNLNAWVTNTAVLCTVTGVPSDAMGFDRVGNISWRRIQ
jgi:hypothetical protein